MSRQEMDGLGLDSSNAPGMIVMPEARLDIEVREEEIKKIRTVEDVVDFVRCRMESGKGR
jgi:acyl carrier protein